MPRKATLPLTEKSPVVTVRFGPLPPLTGPAGLLETVPAPSGHKHNWRVFLERADDDLLESLHRAFRFDGSMRDSMLVAACCESHDGMGRTASKRGGLKPTAVRFAHHAIATVDFCVSYSQMPQGLRWFKESVMSAVAFSYRVQTPPTGKQPRGKLTEQEASEARAACLVHYATDSGKVPDMSTISFIAEQESALSAYVPVIIAEKDTSRYFLESLAGMQPAPALLSGML